MNDNTTLSINKGINFEKLIPLSIPTKLLFGLGIASLFTSNIYLETNNKNKILTENIKYYNYEDINEYDNLFYLKDYKKIKVKINKIITKLNFESVEDNNGFI